MSKKGFTYKKTFLAVIVLGVIITNAAHAQTQVPAGTTTGNGALAVGTNSIASGPSTSVGTGAVSSNNSTAVGNAASVTGASSVGLGVNVDNKGNSSIAIGSAAKIGNGTLVPNGAIAIGTSAESYGNQATSLGHFSKAQRLNDTALGALAEADNGGLPGASGATAAGASARAIGSQTTAIGSVSAATAELSTAVGAAAAAQATYSTAVGAQSHASGVGSSALGMFSEALGTQATGTGYNAKAYGSNSTAIGALANAGTTTNTFATSIGNQTNATAQNSTALGAQASASGASGLALGFQASASNASSVALGAYSLTAAPVAPSALTIRGTTYNVAGGVVQGTVSLGSFLGTRQVQYVAPGRISSTSTDAINGSQAYGIVQAVEALQVAGSTNPYVAFNSTKGAATATGANSSAVGPAASAGAPEASAFGTEALAGEARSTAIGTRSAATGANSSAFGADSVASVTNSVALGNASTTTAGLGNAGVVLRGTSYAFAGSAPAGVVSIGLGGLERQLQNVAAGSRATDAVNKSQLDAAYQAISAITEGGGTTPMPYTKFNSDEADASATGRDTSAVGPAAKASGERASAFGAFSEGSGENSLALGARSVAKDSNSVALGSDSVTSSAIGNVSTIIRGTTYNYVGTSPAGSVSVGSVGAERQIKNVAAGSSDTDAANMSQVRALEKALNTFQPSSAASTVVNNTYVTNTNQAPFFNANTTGADSKASGTESVAIGGNATATSSQSISIGSNSSTTGASAVALGYGAQATGTNSVAIGANTVASRDNEVNIGGRTIGNVARATVADQGVNLGQMQEGDRASVAEANSYTDNRAAQTLSEANNYTNNALRGLRKEMDAGDAAALAAGSIVYGEQGYGMAAAVVNSQPAIAWGKRWASETQPGVFYGIKFTGARKKVGVSLALGW